MISFSWNCVPSAPHSDVVNSLVVFITACRDVFKRNGDYPLERVSELSLLLHTLLHTLCGLASRDSTSKPMVQRSGP